MNEKENIQPTNDQTLTNKSSKKNNGPMIIIIVLVIIILGMGVYILYEKGVILSDVNVEDKETSNKKNINKKKQTVQNNDTTSDEIKPLDVTKCLNNSSNNTYSNPTDVEEKIGLSMSVNSDKRGVTLSVDWNTFGPISGASMWNGNTEQYQVTKFDKDIKSTFLGGVGQDATGAILFYLMEDGTVEYTPVFNTKTDTQGNVYYTVNYASGDDTHFEVKGTVPNVSDVIKLYQISASNGSGWSTTIGAKKDGSFYDLGSIINQ